MRNLHQLFDWQYIGQKIGGILQNFVAFSEYINFKGITESGDKEGSSFEVKFSMLEIYNEVAIDLLDAKNSGKKKQSGLKIRQHPKRGFYGT